MEVVTEMGCRRLGAGFCGGVSSCSHLRQVLRSSSWSSRSVRSGEAPARGCRLRTRNPCASVCLAGEDSAPRKRGPVLRLPSPQAPSRARSCRRGRASFAEERVSEAVEAEIVDGPADVPDDRDRVDEGDDDEDEDLGIDKDGNITGAIPDEFLEMMKDRGNPPNYWFLGLGATVTILARKAIWAELQRWKGLLIFAGVAAVDLVMSAFLKLVELGGQPLAAVIVFVSSIVLTINNFFKLIAKYVPPGPLLYAIILSSTVLLVGESVSNTYDSTQREFPSRNTLDLAGILGLAGFVGLIPLEAMLLGLAAMTVNLLLVRKVNPVAGFTPVAGVLAAVAVPVVRYPVLLSFIGSSLFRYWSLGYLSKGAVPRERTTEYPRVLTGLLYLVGVSVAARTFYYIVDMVRAAILLYSR